MRARQQCRTSNRAARSASRMRCQHDGAVEVEIGHAAGVGLVDGLDDAWRARAAAVRNRRSSARSQASRIAWHSIAMRACMTSSIRSACWASAKVKKSFSTEMSGRRHDSADAVADLDDAEHVRARSASRTIGRLTPGRASSRSGSGGRRACSEPASRRSRKKAKDLLEPFFALGRRLSSIPVSFWSDLGQTSR